MRSKRNNSKKHLRKYQNTIKSRRYRGGSRKTKMSGGGIDEKVDSILDS